MFEATTTFPESHQGGQSPPMMLTYRDIAEQLQVSEKTVLRMVDRGEIFPPRKLGRSRRFRRTDFLRWLDQGCPAVVDFQDSH